MLEEMTAGLRRRTFPVLALTAAMAFLGAAQPPLADLDGHTLAAFHDQFNRAADEVRIILLLSPT